MKKTAVQLMERTEIWCESHFDMYVAFCSKAVWYSRNGMNWTTRKIAEELRYDTHFKRKYGEQFRIPNEILAPLGRMIVQEYPKTAPFYRHSHSIVDDL